MSSAIVIRACPVRSARIGVRTKRTVVPIQCPHIRNALNRAFLKPVLWPFMSFNRSVRSDA